MRLQCVSWVVLRARELRFGCVQGAQRAKWQHLQPNQHTMGFSQPQPQLQQHHIPQQVRALAHLLMSHLPATVVHQPHTSLELVSVSHMQLHHRDLGRLVEKAA